MLVNLFARETSPAIKAPGSITSVYSLNFFYPQGNQLMQTWIFIDFWNFQLSTNKHAHDRNYRLDWKKLSPFLISETEQLLGGSLQFSGTNVYLSYNSRTKSGKGLLGWAKNTLALFPGISVVDKERSPRHPPTCPHCHKRVTNCPHCGGQMVGTIEKGIDTAIVTDMMRLAWDGILDVAILASSDRDFIPAVQCLQAKNVRVVNVLFPPLGMDLANTCWASLDMRPHLATLAR